MRFLPIAVDLRGRRAVVVGGCAQAARRVGQLAAAEASVRVIAPRVSRSLAEVASRCGAEVVPRRYRDGDLSLARVAFVTSRDGGVRRAVAEEARRRSVWLHVEDAPELSDFAMPALLRRGAVTVAVGTGGASPALARWLRDEIGRAWGDELGRAAEHLAMLRRRLPAGKARRRAFARLLADGLVDAFRRGDASRVAVLTERACGSPPGAS